MKIYISEAFLNDIDFYYNLLSLKNIRGVIVVTNNFIEKKRLNLFYSSQIPVNNIKSILNRISIEIKNTINQINVILFEIEIDYDTLNTILNSDIEKYIYLDYDLEDIRKWLLNGAFFSPQFPPIKNMHIFNLYKGINDDDVNVKIGSINNFIENFLQILDIPMKYEYLYYSLGELVNTDDEEMNLLQEELKTISGTFFFSNKLVEKINNFIVTWNKSETRKKDTLLTELIKIEDELIEIYNNSDLVFENSKYFSFIGEMIYSSKVLKENVKLKSDDFTNTKSYRSNRIKLTYIHNLKRNATMNLIRETMTVINLKIARQEKINSNLIFQSFLRYNQSRNVWKDLKGEVITFDIIEEYAFVFQNIDLYSIDFSEIVVLIPPYSLGINGIPPYECKAVCIPANINVIGNVYVETDEMNRFVKLLSYNEARNILPPGHKVLQMKYILPQ